MRIKKILSLAVVLAMVLTVVPGLGLIASAAEAGYTSDELIELAGEPLFDVTTLDYSQATSDGDLNANNVEWTTAWTGSNNQSGSGQPNMNFNNKNGNYCLQVYGQSKNNNQWGAGVEGSITSPGYGKDNDFFVLQFRASTSSKICHDIAVFDTANKVVARFRVDNRDNNVGITPEAPGFGCNYTHNSKVQNILGDKSLAGDGGNAYMRIAVYNISTDAYNVDYYMGDAEDGTYTLVESVTCTGQNADGFGGLTHAVMQTTGWWDNYKYNNLKIYAGDFNAEDKATVTINAGGEEVKECFFNKKCYPDGYTIDPYYSADGSSVLYKSSETTFTDTATVDMDVVPNPDVAGLKKGGTVENEGTTYTIVSDNLISNGDFSEELNGWFGANSNAETTYSIDASNFEFNNDGTVKSKASKGTNDRGSLYRSWAVEPGATYVFHQNTSAENTYLCASLAKALGSGDGSSDGVKAIIGKGDASSSGREPTYDTNKTGDNDYFFTVPEEGEGYKYFEIKYRWYDGSYGNFGLYKLAEQKLMTVDGKKYSVLSDNLIANGDFENGDPDANVFFSWDGPNSTKVTLNSEIKLSTEQNHTEEGSNSLKVITDGGSSTASGKPAGTVLAQVDLNGGEPVTEDATYILSSWVYSKSNKITITIGGSSNKDGNQIDYDNNVTKRYGNNGDQGSDPTDLKANDWNNIVCIFNAKAGQTVCAEWFARWCGGYYFDDLELYKVIELEPNATVNVNYTVDGDSVATDVVEGLYQDDSYTYNVPNFVANKDYTLFYTPNSADPQNIEKLELGKNSLTVECTAVDFAELTKLPNGDITYDGKNYRITGTDNLVPNPSFETQDGNFSSVGWYAGCEHDKTSPGVNIVPYPTAHRYDNTDATDGSHSFGSRYGNAWNGECTVLNNFKAEAGKTYAVTLDVKYVDTKDPNNGAQITLGVANGANAVCENKPKIEEKINNLKGKDWTTKQFVITVPEDFDEPYIQLNFFNIGNKDNSASSSVFLFDNISILEAVELAEAPASALGWDGTSFTVNFTGAEDGQSIKVYGEKAEGGDYEAVGSPAEISGENIGAAVTTEATNRLYKAAVISAEGIEGVLSAPTSIYKLVVDALTAEGEGGVDPAKLGAINEVISKGGVYYDAENAATAEGKKLFDLSVEEGTVTVTVKKTIADLGVGFVLAEGSKVYFGSESKEATVQGNEAASEVYDVMTINTEANTVTLSKSAGLAEAVTLSLDSVNIEFVETLIEEAEAANVDAETGLTPEL